MKIVVDGFGGDKAPVAVLQGCELALKEYSDIEILVTGDIETLQKVARDNKIDISNITLVHASTIIPIEADPTSILNEYKDCSMAVAFNMLAKGECDAVVCAGSTGAIVVGASLIVKRIKGVKRAALAPIMPANHGCYILMDVGANIECRPEMLLQFAIMGSVYMDKIMNVNSPRVGLVNIGAEPTKGGELQIASYETFNKCKHINFTGNIEPRYIPNGDADVVIADGFTGNVILKLTEGMGKMISSNMKEIFGGFVGTLAGALVFGKIKSFKKKMDYTEYGGAPLMGIAKPVIKAHGSSNPKAFKNAIRQARDYAKKGVIEQIATSIEEMKLQVKE